MALPFQFSVAARVFDGFEQPRSYVEEDLYELERADLEEMLGGKPREHLVARDFGTVAWGPLWNLTAAALAYLFPRLMEIAASDATDKSGELFMMLFINRFSEGPSGAEFALLNATHRAAVADFLEHLALTRGDRVREECWDDVLEEGIRNWRTG